VGEVTALRERLSQAQPAPSIDGAALCERFDWNRIAVDTLSAYDRALHGMSHRTVVPEGNRRM
jgi:hypothetical protein